MRSRRVGTVALAALVLFAHVSHAAFAGFSDGTAAQALNVSTGSIAAPTGVGAVAGCVVLSPRVTISWTASASTFTTGYRVLRSVGGGEYAQVGSVEGRTGTSFTDPSVVGAATYSYEVQAVHENWTATSDAATVAVPLLCL